MTDLPRDLRRVLETTVKAAREAAEAGVADALRRLGAFDSRRPAHVSDAQNEARKRLRAHAKSLGDKLDGPDGALLQRLTEAAAYIQWHRLLFARFLGERALLQDDGGVALSLADCREEAALGQYGWTDEWAIAAGHATRMLPGVFPPDDPAETLQLAPEHDRALRDHLRRLPPEVFTADDSLGWTYQFWRATEKKRVNDSQVKIGAYELPAVTQLFTESYMVRFLLHNTLGAWWAGQVLARMPELARDAVDEAALRAACALPGYAWEYLRFVREGDAWRPAAGVFPGWPGTAAELTVLDPCCGSGHFLTEALAALAALRCAGDAALTPAAAVAAVLRDNLAGLEIDGRCVQIAAFTLALAAWRIGGAGVPLPTPNVAWVGAPPPLPRSEFAALANGDTELRRGLEALHELFVDAPLLGSLIDPVGGDLVDPARVARIEGSIGALVERMRGAEPERAEGAVAARGMADAAAILARRWVLQVTNVPFLGRGRQHDKIKAYLESRFDAAKFDLATAMLNRMWKLSENGGSVAAVTPQHWLFLGGYSTFRKILLRQMSLDMIAGLGPRCFETISGEVVNAALIFITASRPSRHTSFAGLNANDGLNSLEKATTLLNGEINALEQVGQQRNPDERIGVRPPESQKLLEIYARGNAGMRSGDAPQYILCFWEIEKLCRGWKFQQSTIKNTNLFDGCEHIIHWENGNGRYFDYVQAQADAGYKSGVWKAGDQVWGKLGVLVSQMSLHVSLYLGDAFDNNASAVVCSDLTHLPAVWAFCSSPDYAVAIRRIDRKLNVTNATLVKVPFDLPHWQAVAAENYPNGLPEPYSDDPTQWLFHGHPCYAASGTELHVALARLAGYRWPAETDTAMRLAQAARERIAGAATLPAADDDGLLPLVPVGGERPLADRLRAYCAAAWGDDWQPGTEAALVAAACERAKDRPPRQPTLDAWLRTHAAKQHAKLFHDRPFLWWVTDGRSDGFTAVVHYHRLDRTTLERLAWTVLGDWITRLGADPRAEAARTLQPKLAAILEGEAPYDIFVRWKPLHAQPIGWEPDLDDGVRLNIRPFLRAGVLSYAPAEARAVDRGKDVRSAPWFDTFGGERRNDHNTKLQEKRDARNAASLAGPS